MRRGFIISGIMVLTAAWLGPLPELAQDAFYAHMTMHMGVVAVAAPLVAFGVAGGRFDPVRRWPAPFHPIPASVVELMIVWGWHAPGLHHFARGSAWGLVVEQSMFLAAGLLLWLAAFGGQQHEGRLSADNHAGRAAAGGADVRRAGRQGTRVARREGVQFDGREGAEDVQADRRAGAGVVGLLLTAMHMTLLGALLALATRPLYHDGGAPWFGGEVLTPIQDQHLGGAIMLLVGGVSYLAGGLVLSARVLRRATGGSDTTLKPLVEESA